MGVAVVVFILILHLSCYLPTSNINEGKQYHEYMCVYTLIYALPSLVLVEP